MKPDLERAWLKATPNERQAFIEFFADDIKEMLPAYDDRDEPDELIAYEQDGDDEQLDSAELPAVIDTSIECSVSDDDDEDFHAATRGNRRRASGKPVLATPSSDEVERLIREFLSRGGQIAKVRPGISGLQQTKPRVPRWRQIVSSKGA